jgi:hypothetical protein
MSISLVDMVLAVPAVILIAIAVFLHPRRPPPLRMPKD